MTLVDYFLFSMILRIYLVFRKTVFFLVVYYNGNIMVIFSY
nr:MAG TPA: hypothetical protein [Caudoviricetes sp.]